MSVALLIWHAKRMRHIASICRIFSTLFNKQHDLRNMFRNMKCVFWFSMQILSDNFVIPRRIHGYIIIKVCRSSCTVPIRYSYHILMELECFSTHFLKIIKTSNFMKMRSLGAELFRADSRRSDRYDEANRRFPQFCKRAREKLIAYWCRILWQLVCFTSSNSKLCLNVYHYLFRTAQ